VAEEITSICADFPVVDAVLRNRSPAVEFPANREKNREFLSLFLGSSSEIVIGIRPNIIELQLNSLQNIAGNYLQANSELVFRQQGSDCARKS
jgi:hypothetical protein